MSFAVFLKQVKSVMVGKVFKLKHDIIIQIGENVEEVLGIYDKKNIKRLLFCYVTDMNKDFLSVVLFDC